MLAFTYRLSPNCNAIATLSLSLTAEQRTRSRYRFTTTEGQPVLLHLPRGIVLRDGDRLQADSGEVLQILARPEPVLTVLASDPLDLLRAAYHLGNRHVPLEIAPTCLRLAPDPVLKAMLEQLGLWVREEIAPFHPEIGAYHQHH